jgi:hypothetical protein
MTDAPNDDRAVLATRSRAFRGRVLARLDDGVASVRAYAETASPALAVELLKVLASLEHERGRFDRLTRASK